MNNGRSRSFAFDLLFMAQLQWVTGRSPIINPTLMEASDTEFAAIVRRRYRSQCRPPAKGESAGLRRGQALRQFDRSVIGSSRFRPVGNEPTSLELETLNGEGCGHARRVFLLARAGGIANPTGPVRGTSFGAGLGSPRTLGFVERPRLCRANSQEAVPPQ
jgi:hypothetical protein